MLANFELSKQQQQLLDTCLQGGVAVRGVAVVVVTLTKYCHYYYYGQWAVRCPCVCVRVCVRCGLELSGENQNK